VKIVYLDSNIFISVENRNVVEQVKKQIFETKKDAKVLSFDEIKVSFK